MHPDYRFEPAVPVFVLRCDWSPRRMLLWRHLPLSLVKPNQATLGNHQSPYFLYISSFITLYCVSGIFLRFACRIRRCLPIHRHHGLLPKSCECRTRPTARPVVSAAVDALSCGARACRDPMSILATLLACGFLSRTLSLFVCPKPLALEASLRANSRYIPPREH